MQTRFWKQATGMVVLLLVLAPVVAGQQPQADIVSTLEEIQNEFAQIPCGQEERRAAVRALFIRMGAGWADMRDGKLRNADNFVVRHAAPSGEETIVIGAHYDFIDEGCGAIDNWSGVVVLAHVYKTVRQFQTKKNVLFVAFDREEKGLVGSRAMVNAIPKNQLPQYCAMINVDSFGLAAPFALTNLSSEPLVKLTEEVAANLQMPFNRVAIRDAGADSESFRSKKIPAITLSGISDDWRSILHTRNDQAEKVNAASVYFGYRLALALWKRIDDGACDAFRDEKAKARADREPRPRDE